MANEALNRLFEQFSQGEVPDMLAVMSALNELPELLTLDSRPPESSDPLTTCQIYHAHACQD